MIKIIIGQRIRCRRKCHNLKIKTSTSTGAKHLVPAPMTGRDRDRIHFSKCNNNQPFRGGRISLRESDFSIIRRIIPWTSRTRLTHRSHPTRHPPIRGRVAALHPPRKKISTLVIMQIRCAPLAPWVLMAVSLAELQVVSSWRR
jgi:hypothetical protein